MVLYTVKAHVETKGQGISTTISIVNAMYRKIRISKIKKTNGTHKIFPFLYNPSIKENIN